MQLGTVSYRTVQYKVIQCDTVRSGSIDMFSYVLQNLPTEDGDERCSNADTRFLVFTLEFITRTLWATLRLSFVYLFTKYSLAATQQRKRHVVKIQPNSFDVVMMVSYNGSWHSVTSFIQQFPVFIGHKTLARDMGSEFLWPIWTQKECAFGKSNGFGRS